MLRARQGARGPAANTRNRLSYYARGNALKRAASRYRPEIIETEHPPADRGLHASFFARNADSGAGAADPIFIVGLPRSGSTLIEQILASHSAGRGHQELADIPRIVMRAQGRERGARTTRAIRRVLAQMSAEDFRRLGEKYLSRYARLPHRQAASSSTRCRTTSGTSA